MLLQLKRGLICAGLSLLILNSCANNAGAGNSTSNEYISQNQTIAEALAQLKAGTAGSITIRG